MWNTVLATLIGIVIGWCIKIWYDRHQESKQKEWIVSGLLSEIRRIWVEVLNKDANQYPIIKKELNGLQSPAPSEDVIQLISEFLTDIPENLGEVYKSNLDRLGMLGDVNLEIQKFYNYFDEWKSLHQQIKDNKFEFTNDLKDALGKSMSYIELLIKKAEAFDRVLEEGDELKGGVQMKTWSKYLIIGWSMVSVGLVMLSFQIMKKDFIEERYFIKPPTLIQKKINNVKKAGYSNKEIYEYLVDRYKDD